MISNHIPNDYNFYKCWQCRLIVWVGQWQHFDGLFSRINIPFVFSNKATDLPNIILASLNVILDAVKSRPLFLQFNATTLKSISSNLSFYFLKKLLLHVVIWKSPVPCANTDCLVNQCYHTLGIYIYVYLKSDTITQWS